MTVVTHTILSEGKRLDELAVMSIEIRKEVNRIPHATLMVSDGNVATREFSASDAAFFEPGRKIQVKLRYETETADTTVFEGRVVRHALEADMDGSALRVELKDDAVKLTQGRKSAVWVDTTDNDAIDKLVKAAGLQYTGTATKPAHKQIVQYHCSDWDFIVSRAETQGLLVVVDAGKVALAKADLGASASVKIDYGVSELFDFEFELDAAAVAAEVGSRSWDVKEAKLTALTNAKAFALKQGNLKDAKVADAMGFKSELLSHPVPMAPEELQAWANGQLMRSRLAMIRGRVGMPGIAGVKLLDTVQIESVGARFTGTALVTGIRHYVGAGGWRTDLQLGLGARPFALEEGVTEPPAAGLLPGIRGLQVGIVYGFEEDPDGQFRVKVMLPGVGDDNNAVWARLAAPDAGNDRGWFFRPEAGDEVVVGFFNNDPRQPVVLGALYGKNAPSSKYGAITDKNQTKAIVSRTGTAIGFLDDDKGSAFIETADGAKVTVDDKAKAISFKDQNGNEITMDENGITIKSAKDLKVDASGNVEIKGAKVDLK